MFRGEEEESLLFLFRAFSAFFAGEGFSCEVSGAEGLLLARLLTESISWTGFPLEMSRRPMEALRSAVLGLRGPPDWNSPLEERELVDFFLLSLPRRCFLSATAEEVRFSSLSLGLLSLRNEEDEEWGEPNPTPDLFTRRMMRVVFPDYYSLVRSAQRSHGEASVPWSDHTRGA